MAEGIIKDAFERLKCSISSDDARDFHSTTLHDVRSAARAIQDEQASRQSLLNMRRVEPFLKFAEQYAAVLEVVCQGFSPMAWVWVGTSLISWLINENIHDRYGRMFSHRNADVV